MQKKRKSTYSQSARHSQPAVTGIFVLLHPPQLRGRGAEQGAAHAAVEQDTDAAQWEPQERERLQICPSRLNGAAE